MNSAAAFAGNFVAGNSGILGLQAGNSPIFADSGSTGAGRSFAGRNVRKPLNSVQSFLSLERFFSKQSE
jgi:hypothetical protein